MTQVPSLSQQHDELEALQAIYGDESFVFDLQAHTCQIILSSAPGQRFALAASLRPEYPSLLPPDIQLIAPSLSEDTLAWAASQLQQLFTPGDVCLYEWAEWLRAQEVLWPKPHSNGQIVNEHSGEMHCAQHTASIRGQDGNTKAPENETEAPDPFVHGDPFVQKKSTFQGHLTPVLSISEVEARMDLLLQNSKVQKATHNIMAYRIHNEATGSFIQDCDDDGEDAAGRRLLHMLQMVEAQDVLVVVSRWFGGVLLGPARFTHINNAARSLLQEAGYVSRKSNSRVKGKGKS